MERTEASVYRALATGTEPLGAPSECLGQAGEHACDSWRLPSDRRGRVEAFQRRARRNALVLPHIDVSVLGEDADLATRAGARPRGVRSGRARCASTTDAGGSMLTVPIALPLASLVPAVELFVHRSTLHGQAHVSRVMVHAFRLLEATGWPEEAPRLWA